MAEWQPIDTAPKKEHVLVCNAGPGHPYIPETAWNFNGTWFGSGTNRPLHWKPTHWQRRPEAPPNELDEAASTIAAMSAEQS